MLDHNSVESNVHANVPPKGAPYDPLMLYLVALIFSPLAVGLVGAVNWRRLGKPGRFWSPILFSILILFFVLLIAFMLTIKFPAYPGVFSVIFSALGGFLFAAWINNRQGAYYQNWIQTFGEPKGSGCLELVGMGIVAAVIGLAFSVVVSPLLTSTATAVVNTVAARQTFKHDSFTMTYPAAWYLVDAKDASIRDNCSQVECVVTVRAVLGGGGIQIARFDDSASKIMTLGALDAQIVGALRDQIVNEGKASLLTIDQQNAILRRVELQSGKEWVVFVRDKNGDMLRIIAFESPDSNGRYDADIENIIHSIQFNEVGT
jgi:hypothetical protein